MKTACCPYCESEHFTADAVRADAINPDDPERYANVYGDWFNRCAECDGWSVHRGGKQFKLSDKSHKPKRNSEPPL